jgi:hypothetical protein
MGLLTGRVSGAMLRTDPQALNHQGVAALVERQRLAIERRAFRPIDPARGELSSHGWVHADNILDAYFSRIDRLVFGDMVSGCVLLSLRRDTIRLNAAMFKARVRAAVARELHDSGRVSLAREQRLIIEDSVRLDLIKQTQPTTAVREMAWMVPTGLIYFSSASARDVNLFCDLFSESFGLSLEPCCAASEAGRIAGEARYQAFTELLPSAFSPEAPCDDFNAEDGDEA